MDEMSYKTFTKCLQNTRKKLKYKEVRIKTITPLNLISFRVGIIVGCGRRLGVWKSQGLLKGRRDDGCHNVLKEHFMDIVH